jgi:hypothetical protein
MKFMSMDFGICLAPVIPLRKEPNDRSEMLTQILFGEAVRIYEKSPKWYSVETDLDAYTGWAGSSQLELLEEAEYSRTKQLPVYLTSGLFSVVEEEIFGVLHLPTGSCLPGLRNNQITIANRIFRFSGEARIFKKHPIDEILKTAFQFMNAPYLWGGRTIFGIDCSGFTQAVFRLNGINLPRDARQQSARGEPVSLLSEALPGDLAFFDNSEGDIIHVGIVLDTQSILHASGKVRKDTLDHHGIFDQQSKKYTHRLRLIRRIIE